MPSYTSWATSGMEGAHWNSHANPYAWYGGQMEMEETKAFDDGEKKGLTDAEILKSKRKDSYYCDRGKILTSHYLFNSTQKQIIGST